MKQVIFRREARADALDAYRWYEKQEPGLGAEFREELRATIERIRGRPLAFRVLHRDTRRARLETIPFWGLLS
jgi:plasmid stabilization system protein ParE